MRKNERRQTKIKAEPIKLDTDEFYALTDILFELFKENHSACAKILGVSRITWRKWEKEPPTFPWWNLILRYIIKNYLASLASSKGLTKAHRLRLLDRFNELPDHEDLLTEIDSMAYNLAAAVSHLRRLLMRKGMFWKDIRLPANSGGFSRKTLYRAATKLGVVKTQEGYGDSKESFWSLPDEDS